MDDSFFEDNYLTDIPQDIEKYGFCKTLLVRHEVIHIKHILSEIFVRKSINIEKYLNKINWSLFQYMEYMTNQLRKVHKFNRKYNSDLNKIVKSRRSNFFPTIELYDGLNNIIALDFDGVVTKNSFAKLYELCNERLKTVICSANPEVKNEYFIKKELSLPKNIYSCKGKIKKINKLIELNKIYDYVFFIDNEKEYLEFAWLFGLQTYIYENNKIKNFTLKTK